MHYLQHHAAFTKKLRKAPDKLKQFFRHKRPLGSRIRRFHQSNSIEHSTVIAVTGTYHSYTHSYIDESYFFHPSNRVISANTDTSTWDWEPPPPLAGPFRTYVQFQSNTPISLLPSREDPTLTLLLPTSTPYLSFRDGSMLTVSLLLEIACPILLLAVPGNTRFDYRVDFMLPETDLQTLLMSFPHFWDHFSSPRLEQALARKAACNRARFLFSNRLATRNPALYNRFPALFDAEDDALAVFRDPASVVMMPVDRINYNDDFRLIPDSEATFQSRREMHQTFGICTGRCFPSYRKILEEYVLPRESTFALLNHAPIRFTPKRLWIRACLRREPWCRLPLDTAFLIFQFANDSSVECLPSLGDSILSNPFSDVDCVRLGSWESEAPVPSLQCNQGPRQQIACVVLRASLSVLGCALPPLLLMAIAHDKSANPDPVTYARLQTAFQSSRQKYDRFHSTRYVRTRVTNSCVAQCYCHRPSGCSTETTAR